VIGPITAGRGALLLLVATSTPALVRFISYKEFALNSLILFSLSLFALLAVAAFVREARLRRALQALLRRLLEHWRTRDHE
jgi:hypothetical protein